MEKTWQLTKILSDQDRENWGNFRSKEAALGCAEFHGMRNFKITEGYLMKDGNFVEESDGVVEYKVQK